MRADQSMRAIPRGVGVLLRLGRAQDALLALLALCVIVLMVLPLPPAVLDLLIAVNIGMAVLLLMLSLYVATPVGLSTFPTLLLFTTLFRLALNIASTRAILLNGDAGEIINTFGSLVVGGSVIVGVVVFLIIAIVQFIVIAKGSERVAEVGARFTLDALPGKQMSIDAELRAGLIDKDTARARRTSLQRESELYGAMDGAMKFVKGDAIAGLLIAFVNIVAGISIGVGVRDLELADAASIYTILTIGDGLVSQIPSLFVSLAAGVLITRVSGAEQEALPSLGSQIGTQVLAQPKALLVTAGVLAAFMLIPGFPKLQFLLWAGAFALVGWFASRALRRSKVPDPMSLAGVHRDGIAVPRTRADIDTELVNSYALELRLAESLAPILAGGDLGREVERARETVSRRLGVPFPGMSVQLSKSLPRDHFLILVNEVPTDSGVVEGGRIYARAERGRLEGAGLVPAGTVLDDAGGLWLPASEAPRLEAAEIPYIDAAGLIGNALIRVLRTRAAEFVGVQEVRHLLGEAERAFPDLVAEANRGVPLARIAEVLRRLVEEGVSIRNMRDILQALVEWSPKERDGVLLTECVRIALAPQITYQYGGVRRVIRAITLASDVEEKVRAAVKTTPGGNYLALDPAFAAKVAAEVERRAVAAGVDPASGTRAVVVVSMDIRRYVRQIVEERAPDVAVLAYQNLASNARITGVGEVSVTAT